MRRGNQVGVGAKPTLDMQHLQKLAEEASLDAAVSLAADFTDRLPQFVERIVRTVGARERDPALDASLNMKSKSWLVGALRMNQLCSELELALALADWAAATAVALDIEVHLPRLRKALQAGPHPALGTRRPRTPRAAMAS